MFIKIDQKVIDLLCCPLCKAEVIPEKECFACTSCSSHYPLKTTNVGNQLEKVYDFRIYRPAYCIPESSKLWDKGQQGFESFHKDQHVEDKLKHYLDEINSVADIYTQEFHIQGSILDVGGHQGKLRHFLSDQAVPLYVSIDPFLNVFENIQHQPNLLKAYPCLSQPCNFLVAMAENLPFRSNSFDLVHMRSVIDHLEDPFKAFKEAYRVLKSNGNLMIGLAMMEKLKEAPALSLWTKVKDKLKKEGIKGVAMKILKRLIHLADRDHHIFHFTQAELVDLLSITGFKIEKQHWQKPPFNFCIYLNASVRDSKR